MYNGGASPSSGIWTVNGDGTNKVLIYQDGHNTGGLTWSNDGNKVAYSTGTRIYVVNSDGTNHQRLLVSYPKGINHPDWSPDGSKLLFVSSWGSDDWGSDIYIMDLSGWDGVSWGPSSSDDSRITRLTTGGQNPMFPTWSPDGSRIAFSADPYLVPSDPGPGSQRVGTLSIMNADGSNITSLNTLVKHYEEWGGISWSPNGSKLYLLLVVLHRARFTP
jgi:Tol biopolymer transport system component